MLIVLFLVSHFNFLFVPCGGLSWLPVSFLLHVKYTLSYRMYSFLPRDAMQKRGLCRHAVSVCLSIRFDTHERDKHII